MKLEIDKKETAEVKRIVIETSKGIRFTITECRLTNDLIVNKFVEDDCSIKITPRVSNEIQIA